MAAMAKGVNSYRIPSEVTATILGELCVSPHGARALRAVAEARMRYALYWHDRSADDTRDGPACCRLRDAAMVSAGYAFRVAAAAEAA